MKMPFEDSPYFIQKVHNLNQNAFHKLFDSFIHNRSHKIKKVDSILYWESTFYLHKYVFRVF